MRSMRWWLITLATCALLPAPNPVAAAVPARLLPGGGSPGCSAPDAATRSRALAERHGHAEPGRVQAGRRLGPGAE